MDDLRYRPVLTREDLLAVTACRDGIERWIARHAPGATAIRTEEALRLAAEADARTWIRSAANADNVRATIDGHSCSIDGHSCAIDGHSCYGGDGEYDYDGGYGGDGRGGGYDIVEIDDVSDGADDVESLHHSSGEAGFSKGTA